MRLPRHVTWRRTGAWTLTSQIHKWSNLTFELCKRDDICFLHIIATGDMLTLKKIIKITVFKSFSTDGLGVIPVKSPECSSYSVIFIHGWPCGWWGQVWSTEQCLSAGKPYRYLLKESFTSWLCQHFNRWVKRQSPPQIKHTTQHMWGYMMEH